MACSAGVTGGRKLGITMARPSGRAGAGTTAAIASPSRTCRCQSSGRRRVRVWGVFVVMAGRSDAELGLGGTGIFSLPRPHRRKPRLPPWRGARRPRACATMFAIPSQHRGLCMADLNPRSSGHTFIRAVVIGGAVLFGLWALSPIVVISAGERGVKTTFGKPDELVYEPGIHFKVPLAQAMHTMDVRLQKGEGEGDAASKDLQSVHTRIAINYHLDPKQAVNVFRNIGPSTDIAADRIIIPAAQEAVKAVTARFNAEELVSHRTEVREAIGKMLRDKMQRHGLVLDEFAIVNFAFSRSFAEANIG